jgi:hypothetical protein
MTESGRPRVDAAPGGAHVPVHMFGVFGAFGAPRMFGQWWVALDGAAFLLCAVVLEWVVAVVDVLDEAALAIAAPPPTRAPVTRSVVANDFNFRIRCSPPFVLGTTHDPGPPFAACRRRVRVS